MNVAHGFLGSLTVARMKHAAYDSDQVQSATLQLANGRASPLCDSDFSSLPENPAELASLGRLELIARQLLEGLTTGPHRSPFKFRREMQSKQKLLCRDHPSVVGR